jgi:MSHA biogenesis protein MshM
MLKAHFGLTQEPFYRNELTLLPQQREIAEMLKIHAQHGGFSVIIGEPGVGKTVLREHLESWRQERHYVITSCSRTLQTYRQIVQQLATASQVAAKESQREQALIDAAFTHVRERKAVMTLIDEAHLLAMPVLRQLRLLFEKFPKNHSLVLLGQDELLYNLSLIVHADIKSRITYSQRLLPLTDEDLITYLHHELTQTRLGTHVFDDGAQEVILRYAQGNLRRCRHLCHSSLLEACRANQRTVTIQHVSAVLIQPHWRSHEELMQQQSQRAERKPG